MTKKRLYRNKQKARLAGVCAGIADYFELETWLVRIIVFCLALFNPGLFLILYVAAWLLLDQAPAQAEVIDHETVKVKSQVWQRGESAHDVLQSVDAKLRQVERRVESVEHCLTDEAFKVHREFSKL